MKKETKVAWPKSHPWNPQLIDRLSKGEDISHADLLAAVNDADHQKVFDFTSSAPLKKETHVIFQYGIYLQRSDGKVAVFERAVREQGQDRITSGKSILLSNSSPDSPFLAIPRVIQHQICVGKKRRIAGFTPRGMVWNAVPPGKDGLEKPTYLFALYQHLLPDRVPLHGRFKYSPDTLVDWVEPELLPGILKKSGYIDQFLGTQISTDQWTNIHEGPGGVIFAPESRLRAGDAEPNQFQTAEYSHGHAAFISHASEDSFSAYALYQFLRDESSRSILATLDLTDVRDGDHLTKIERLIRESDGVILIITPSLIGKSDEKRLAGTIDWVKWEIDLALSLGKPVIGFKLGTFGRPYFLPADLVANNKAAYGDWLNEIRHLVQRVQEKFGVSLS